MTNRKLVVHGRKGIELGIEVIHSIKSLQEMSQGQRLLPSVSQRRCRPDGVLNLPTIDIPHCKFPDFFGGERHTDLCQECSPNLRLGRSIEIVKVKSDVDTRAECIIDDLDPIGCKEEDAAVVFEMAKAKYRRAYERRVIRSRPGLTHKTATMAFRIRSWSERCSMYTSACGKVRYQQDPMYRHKDRPRRSR